MKNVRFRNANFHENEPKIEIDYDTEKAVHLFSQYKTEIRELATTRYNPEKDPLFFVYLDRLLNAEEN